MKDIVIIAHNLRSSHNIGSLFRTAEGLGVSKFYLSGYSPYPASQPDDRLPHIAAKVDRDIAKTALGAEQILPWEHVTNIDSLVAKLKQDGYRVVALEQVAKATALPDFITPLKLVIVVGREVEGIEPEVLALCDEVVEIPMFGKKESYNVVQAAAMAMYHCRCIS